MVETAYFRVYLAWELFLEDAFVLYLLGRQAPRGRAVVRYSFPPSPKAAKEWVAEGREYASWVDTTVASRATRFFRDGRPFTSVLRGSQNALAEARTIRNAVAHEGENAREKFEKVVRQRLLTLPANTTVGSFLVTTRPGVAPPQSFLEFYLDTLEGLATRIVPV